MYASPYLNPIDVKNQKIVLKSFLSQQHKDNGCPSFKAFAQGFSIKVVTAEGANPLDHKMRGDCTTHIAR